MTEEVNLPPESPHGLRRERFMVNQVTMMATYLPTGETMPVEKMDAFAQDKLEAAVERLAASAIRGQG